MITLVTGEKNAGKSSYLYNWFYKENTGYGVISIKRYNKKSFIGYDLLLLPSGERINLCIHLPENYQKAENDIIQGQYRFNPDAFNYAYQFIFNNMQIGNPGPIWLDEIGELELAGKGFMPILKHICTLKQDLRLSIRLSCLTKITNLLKDNPFQIIYLTKY